MKRLLYISTATEAISTKNLEQILGHSRANNAAHDITGLLVAGGRRFLQVLEGPDKAVDDIFEKIRQDPRHNGVVKLHDKTIEKRSFGDWAMGFREASRALSGDNLEEQVAALV